MTISDLKFALASVEAQRDTAKNELAEKLQNCLNEIKQCGFVLFCNYDDNVSPLDNVTQDFTLKTELEFVKENL